MTSVQSKVGRRLAASVADQLDRGKHLAYSHRDYCGIGLSKDGNFYIYDSVYDGFPPVAKTASPISAERLIFSSRKEFINWLSEHTDASLAGERLTNKYSQNQRLTISRLEEFCA